MSIFVIMGLLVCIEAPPGSSAVTPVFVQKGDDLLLNVTEADVPEDFIFVVWKFRENVLVTFSKQGEPTVHDDTGRVETVKIFSVKLKNVQEADSGVYTARVTAKQEKIVAEYNVTVQGSQPSPHNHVIPYVVVPVVVVLVLIICAVGLRLRQRRKNPRENIRDTVYDVPEALSIQGHHSPHKMGATETATGEASDPSTVSEYSDVWRHTESSESRGNTLSEGLYARIDRPVGTGKRVERGTGLSY